MKVEILKTNSLVSFKILPAITADLKAPNKYFGESTTLFYEIESRVRQEK